MSASDNYARQLRLIEQEQAKVEKEKKIYEKAQPIVTNLASGLPDIRANISSAQQICIDGGYNQGGQAYGNGKFGECITGLDSAISNLETALAKIQAKLDELNEKLSTLKKRYNTVHQWYVDALNAEAAAARKNSTS